MNSDFQVQSLCNGTSSMRQALIPMGKDPDVIEIIHKLADIERFWDSINDILREFH
jgi:hypothetical protein